MNSKVGHKTWLYGVWATALKKAEIKNLNFHDLRHTHATWLMQLNTHPAVIQEALGHSSYKTTERYVHAKDRVMAAVDDLLQFTDSKGKMKEISA